jgi:dihydropyrimidinase
MNDFDLVIRNAHIVTAADAFDADIGVPNGVIDALACGVPKAKHEIDAAGHWVSAGIDGH